MGIKTKIEWTDSTINPVMGCTGCALRKDHCYAAVLCTRYAGRKGWPKSFDQPEFFPGRLEKAIRWSDLTGTERPGKPWLNGRPRIIFINDLSDGFCPDVDAWGWLLPYIDAMEASPHVWLLLTKWPDRMREFFVSIGGAPDNFQLGISVENQAAADAHRKAFHAIPAAVKFVSYEPALGPIDWTGWEFIDQLIFGGESGPGARPAHPGWFRNARDWAGEHGIARFMKQWGTWFPRSQWEHDPYLHLPDDCDCIEGHNLKIVGGDIFHRVGKERAGRLLDGREWNKMPNREKEA